MATRSISRSLSLAGSGLSGLWNAYVYWTTASQLPDDAGKAYRMLADPPAWLPWLVMAGFIVWASWAFFGPPRPKNDKGERGNEAPPNPTQNHSGSGDNNMNF